MKLGHRKNRVYTSRELNGPLKEAFGTWPHLEFTIIASIRNFYNIKFGWKLWCLPWIFPTYHLVLYFRQYLWVDVYNNWWLLKLQFYHLDQPWPNPEGIKVLKHFWFFLNFVIFFCKKNIKFWKIHESKICGIMVP